MRDRLVLILVGLFLMLSVIGCNQREINNIAEQDEKHKFEIYLVKEKEEVTGDLSKIQLEDEPLITEDDIITYYWNEHILKMKKDVIEERIRLTSLAGKRFILIVKGERIYVGNFWTMLSSCWPPHTPVIYIEGLPEKNENKKKVSQNERLYSIDFLNNSNDPRSDKRIYKALKEIGILEK